VTGDPVDQEAGPRPPAEMQLRATRAPVTRLSRKALIGLGASAALVISAALFFALKAEDRPPGSELYSTGNRNTPDGLASLPKDYDGLAKPAPRLGPPLPGDLGGPIVAAGAPAPGMLVSPDPEKQRLAQEVDAARTSRLFATTTIAVRGPVSAPSQTSAGPPPVPADVDTADHKAAFLNGPTDHRTLSPERVRPVASPYTVQAGSMIPAALLTGLRSDLPGDVTAQVTESVYDSPTGKILLIPQGARLIGQYDAQIAFGQSRALLVWNRLIMPNGASIVLERQPATDPQGYAGLEDEVDNHWGILFKAAMLSTLLSVGSEAGTSNNENSLVQAIRQGGSQSFSQIGEQVVGRSLGIPPTITIRPGFPVRVLVNRDLVLTPYRT
jgi:type IV secretory pathway VirB10-like protein